MYAAFWNNKLVTAIDEAEKVKNALVKKKKNHYFCPHCSQEVQLVVKAGTAYFRHQPGEVNLAGEKDEHARSKNLLKIALMQAKFSAQTEVTLASGQLRADVLASPRLAFEVQCAPLSEAEFNHRHLLYRQNGIKDIWLVGKRHYLTREIKKSQLIFFRENKLWHNYYFEINPYQKILRLKFNVQREPLTNRIQYQSMNFALSKSGLWQLWHFQPQLITYHVDPHAQKRYLQTQIMQKSTKGLRIAAQLYQNHLTIDDLPNWVYERFRPVKSPDNITLFLHQA